MAERSDRALLVGMPIDDLRAALNEQRDGLIVLPAGGPGDLDAAGEGTPVLIMASDPTNDGVPAATWRADLVGRIAHEPGAPPPDGLPSTWLARRRPPEPSDEIEPHVAPPEDEDDEDDEPDIPGVGPQSFFEVRDLRELPKSEWLFANELVGKQARRGRTFFPRFPILVRLPD